MVIVLLQCIKFLTYVAIYMHDAQGRITPEGKCIYTRQIIYFCSGTLKYCPNLTVVFQPLYIINMGTHYDCGALFYCCHDVLACR